MECKYVIPANARLLCILFVMVRSGVDERGGDDIRSIL
jgi:hypothetical protein